MRHAFATLRQVGARHLPAVRALASAADGALWLATEWTPGTPLRPGPAELEEVLREVAAVAHALQRLHDAGTHHGDVSPGNVVATDDTLTLIDLAQLGRCGTGTPGFMAPEVLAGGGGPAADRFSLGALLTWRLWGEVPWSRPESLLEVRGRADVAARLDAMGAAELPSTVRALAIRLLDPRPDARPSSSGAVARQLLAMAAVDDDVVTATSRWWLPRRWPYAGVSLMPTLKALSTRACRLVIVAGPKAAGRDRVVEELVLQLQGGGVDATLADADRWSADTGSWIETWIEQASTEPVVGLQVSPVDMPSVHRLRGAAQLARQPLIVPAATEVGVALHEAPGIHVLQLEALTQAQAQALLGEGLDAPESHRVSIANALHDATGGWAAAWVQLAQACGQREIESAAEVASVVAQTGQADMANGRARALLHAAWGEPDPRLPVSLAPQGRPHAVALSQARRSLGPSAVREEARRWIGEGGRPSLALALDASDESLLRTALEHAVQGSPEVARAVTTIERDSHAADDLVVFAMERRLAEGEAAAAVELASRVPDDVRGRFAHARALQRLGRTEQALALLHESDDDDPAWRWRKRGLRWRLWVDQGEAARALSEAFAVGVDDADSEGVGEGLALALLWAAYASLVDGDSTRASTRLERARLLAPRDAGPQAAAIAARVLQLIGNLAHGSGALDEAAQAYAEAATAFAEAGEPVGGLMLRGSSCALAIVRLDLDAGIDHGRAALRGLLARGQLSALVEAALNLVRLLGYVGSLREAATIADAVGAALVDGGSDLDRARLVRLHAEVDAASLVHAPTQDHDRGAIARTLVESGDALERAQAPSEAADAWLRAARLWLCEGEPDRAQTLLERARGVSDDLSTQVLEATTRLDLASERQDVLGVQGAVEALSNAASWSSLVRAGRLHSAVVFDRSLLLALRRGTWSAPPQAGRSIVARLLQTLEIVMQKTKPIDHPAVRASLLSEGGDTQLLRELIDDREPDPAPAVSSTPVSTDRYARLLRIYRRFAREERLEPLLEHVVDAVMELTDAERGAVVVRREQGVSIEVTRELGAGSKAASFSRSVIDRVLASGEPVLSVDAAADERFGDSRSISHINLRSVLAVPLRFRGELLGAAYVDHRLRRGNFDEDDLAHMEAFSDLAALAVAHAAAMQSLEDKTVQLEAKSTQLATLLEQREAEVVALREDARRQAPAREGYRGIIGSSARMQTVFRLIDRVADADVPVVVVGESGTGKELVARALHDAGGRAKGAFVAENCGAIPEALLESVLFGHAKGAFTGAQKAKAGLFEAADGGTIFLDEVSEMSGPMQTKLLRVLQEGEVRRVGENAPRKVDVRVVAACNRDLEAMVRAGEFREDLYYRINVVRIDLPPLRERVEDVPPLVAHFIARHGGQGLELAPSVMRALSGFAWPGNVRQLENEVQRWVALCEGAVGPGDLSPAIAGTATATSDTAFDPDDLRIRPRVDRMERELIARALETTGNNQTKAATLLGLSRYGLQKKLKRMQETST